MISDRPICRTITEADKGQLLQLISQYGAELSGKAEGSTRTNWGEALFNQEFILLFGLFDKKELIGFAIVFELPEAVFQRKSGQLDDLFILPKYRGKRLAADLMKAVSDVGQKREWSHLRWSVPESDTSAIRLYERVATEAPWKSFVIRFDNTASL